MNEIYTLNNFTIDTVITIIHTISDAANLVGNTIDHNNINSLLNHVRRNNRTNNSDDDVILNSVFLNTINIGRNIHISNALRYILNTP